MTARDRRTFPTGAGRTNDTRWWPRGLVPSRSLFQGFEALDLAEGQSRRVLTGSEAPVPVDGPAEAVFERQARCPTQTGPGLRGIDLQESRFVRMRAGIGLPPRAIAPEPAESIDDPCDRPRLVGRRTEVPGFTETPGIARQALGEREIARRAVRARAATGARRLGSERRRARPTQRPACNPGRVDPLPNRHRR